MTLVPLASYIAPAAALARSSQVKATVFTLPLHRVGEINLSEAAKAQRRTKLATRPQGAPISRAAAERRHLHAVDNALLSRRPKGKPARVPHAAATGLSTQNVPGLKPTLSGTTLSASVVRQGLRAEELPEPGLHQVQRRHGAHRPGDRDAPRSRPLGRLHLLRGLRRAQLRRLPLG